MRRFVSLFGILALTAFIGCEQLENPNAPVDQDAIRKPQSNQQTDRLDKPNATDLKFNSPENKAKFDEMVAKAKDMLSQHQAQHPAKPAEPMALAKHRKIEVPDDFPTIQDAVNAASPGDEIEVEKGTYTEVVMVITPNIEIKGEDEEEVTVNGGFGVGANGVEIENFNINAAGVFGVGVFVMASSKVEIEGNTISGGFAGIALIECTKSMVKDNELSGNILGIVLILSNNNILDANKAKDNLAGIALGFLAPGGDKNNLTNNDCDENFVVGIALSGVGNKLSGNSCNRCGFVGIFVDLASENTIGPGNTANKNGDTGLVMESGTVNNTVKRNTFRDNTNLDIFNAGTGNKFKSNKAKNTSGV